MRSISENVPWAAGKDVHSAAALGSSVDAF